MGGAYEPANTEDVDLGHMEAYGAEPVEIQHVDPDERQMALILNVVFLIGGLFFFPIWAAGFLYRKHQDPTVQTLAKINIGLFLLIIILMLCFFVIFILFAVVSLVIFIILAIIGAAGFGVAASNM